MAEPRIGRFRGLEAGEAVELGELLAFFSDRLASDPNRLDASLYEFVGVPDYVGPVCRADELRAEVDRFAGMLLGYAVGEKQLPTRNAGRVVNCVGAQRCFIGCFWWARWRLSAA